MSKIRGIVLLLCIIVVMLILSLYLGYSCKEGATTATPATAGSRPATAGSTPATAATSTSTSTSPTPVTDCKKFNGHQQQKKAMEKNAGNTFNNCGNGNAKCNVNDFLRKNLTNDVEKSAGIENDECYKKFKANPTKKDNSFVSPNECECNSFGDKCTTKAINENSNASFNVCYTKK